MYDDADDETDKGRMFKRTICSSTIALLTVGTLLLGVLRAVEAAELDGCTPSTLDGFDCAASFQFQGGLPDDGRTFTVHWATYEVGEPLQMAMQAQTDGYIALGFPKWPDSMFGAASVIGYVDDTGVAVVQPYLLQGYSQSDVVVDSSALALADTGGEEVEVSVDGGQTSPMTVISFSLEQLPEGVDPATAPVDIIFAVGDSDEVSYHGPFNKGSGVIDVLSAPSIADAAPEAAPRRRSGAC